MSKAFYETMESAGSWRQLLLLNITRYAVTKIAPVIIISDVSS